MEKQFYVGKTVWHYYQDRYDTYAEAEQAARSSAWRNGQDYTVFTAKAVAKAPEQVNSVKIETVD